MVNETNRTRRWARWLGAAGVLAAAALAVQLHLATKRANEVIASGRVQHRAEGELVAAPAATAPSIAVEPSGDHAQAGVEAEDPELIALAGLPPEDVEWVIDRVERTQSVRALSAAERLQLMSELASIRMFAVLERTEDMTPRAEVMP